MLGTTLYNGWLHFVLVCTESQMIMNAPMRPDCDTLNALLVAQMCVGNSFQLQQAMCNVIDRPASLVFTLA